jgi:hypothetical protein
MSAILLLLQCAGVRGTHLCPALPNDQTLLTLAVAAGVVVGFVAGQLSGA